MSGGGGCTIIVPDAFLQLKEKSETTMMELKFGTKAGKVVTPSKRCTQYIGSMPVQCITIMYDLLGMILKLIWSCFFLLTDIVCIVNNM